MTSTDATTFTARSPEDLLAVVPVVLGFAPQASVVMLTFGAERSFHARVDLPVSPDDVAEVVGCLLGPARRHQVRQVVFVVYAADARHAGTVLSALRRGCRDVGIEVVDALRAHEGRWFSLLPGRRPGVPAWGVPYDLTAHPFAAQAVLDGRVTHGSREDLAASLAPDAARVADLVTASAALPRCGRSDGSERVWAGALVARAVRVGTTPDDREAARLLAAVQDFTVRNAVWLMMTRADAHEHVELWADLVRRSPRELLPAPAALLAFAAWLAGHGALAWCALDRCDEVEPDHGLASVVGELLNQAVPPDVWEEQAGVWGVDDSA